MTYVSELCAHPSPVNPERSHQSCPDDWVTQVGTRMVCNCWCHEPREADSA